MANDVVTPPVDPEPSGTIEVDQSGRPLVASADLWLRQERDRLLRRRSGAAGGARSRVGWRISIKTFGDVERV